MLYNSWHVSQILHNFLNGNGLQQQNPLKRLPLRIPTLLRPGNAQLSHRPIPIKYLYLTKWLLFPNRFLIKNQRQHDLVFTNRRLIALLDVGGEILFGWTLWSYLGDVVEDVLVGVFAFAVGLWTLLVFWWAQYLLAYLLHA